MMLGYLVASGLVLTRLRRPLARFTIEEQRLEGEFRNVNSRLITHSEEIAFYGGNQREQETMNNSFARLVRHLRKAMQFRFAMGITDSIITKYVYITLLLIYLNEIIVKYNTNIIIGISPQLLVSSL